MVFMKHGLHCVGCHVAAFESIEQGAEAHGIDVDALVADLNKVVSSKKAVELPLQEVLYQIVPCVRI